jgi:hypothetical protein
VRTPRCAARCVRCPSPHTLLDASSLPRCADTKAYEVQGLSLGVSALYNYSTNTCAHTRVTRRDATRRAHKRTLTHAHMHGHAHCTTARTLASSSSPRAASPPPPRATPSPSTSASTWKSSRWWTPSSSSRAR